MASNHASFRLLMSWHYNQNEALAASVAVNKVFLYRLQEVITSSPIYRTETVYATSTIPLFLGAKKFFTTLTQSIGITTVTDYETMTVNAALPGK